MNLLATDIRKLHRRKNKSCAHGNKRGSYNYLALLSNIQN